MRKKHKYPESCITWPELDDEIGSWKKYLKGRCLNAGAGHRDLSHLVDGELVNQDIEGGLHNDNIHIYSPLHSIPVENGHFDSIICNAVLEHVSNPEEIMDEFHRVLKPGGHLYLCIPFLQPFHADPTDYQRYTQDGLQLLAEKHGFQCLEIEAVHSVYHTLGWILDLWLRPKTDWPHRLLRGILFPILRNRTRHSKEQSIDVASAIRLIAVRN
jgi:SAM-dependent methyltransferase